MKKNLFIIPILLAALVACGSDSVDSPAPDPEVEVTAIAFSPAGDISLRSTTSQTPESRFWQMQLSVEAEMSDGSRQAVDPSLVKFSSSNSSVAEVDGSGMVTAVARGKVVVKADYEGCTASASVEVTPMGVSTTGVEQFTAQNIYSKFVYLIRNTVIQGFDIASDGTIYYMQLGGSDKHDLYVMRARPNASPADHMIFRYSGHGTNMAIEEAADGKTYVWTGTYASRNSSNDYWSNSVVTRTEYRPGKTLTPEQCGDLFYLGGICELHPAIDVENDVLAINYPGSTLRMFVMYRLSEALALPRSYVTLPSRSYGGGTSTDPAATNSPKVYVRDLTKLTPLGRFGIPKSGTDHTVDISSYAWQGFDVDSGKIYYFEGEGTASDGSGAYFTVFDFDGNIVEQRAEVVAASDRTSLSELGITESGYMEAEGIKVHGDNLYLGFASRSKADGDKRRANIFVYTPAK